MDSIPPRGGSRSTVRHIAGAKFSHDPEIAYVEAVSRPRSDRRADFSPLELKNLEPLRACFKISRGPVFGQKAGWRGATREHTRSGL